MRMRLGRGGVRHMHTAGQGPNCGGQRAGSPSGIGICSGVPLVQKIGDSTRFMA
jgi:hypothetical protein